MTIDNIPQELRALSRWLIYYLKPNPKPGKKATKHPTVKYAADEHKSNLRPLDALRTRPLTKGGGYQICVDKSAGYVFVDIDKCRNVETGYLTPEAQEIVDSLDTYCEISASGTGLHLVCRGTLESDFHVDGHPVEIYSGNIPNKLIAMTGDVLGGHYILCDRQAEASALLKKCQADVGAKASPQEFTEEVVFKGMSDVEEKPINWIWFGRIPLSAVTLYTGNPDTGKTTAYCDLAARVSSLTPFPDVPKHPNGNAVHTFGGHVILLTAEDDYARDIKPKLMAAGANLRKIAYIEKVAIRQGAKSDERMFALDEDLKKLEAALGKKADKGGVSASLIIIDPISSYFGRGSMYKAQDIRIVFNRLTQMCEKFGVAVVAVEHFSKRSDVAAIHKLGGGVAITAAARAVFMFAHVPDEDGQHVMHFVKGNFAKRKTGLRFTIEEKKVGKHEITGTYIKWGAEDSGTADDILRAEKGLSEDNRALRAAKFLKEFLTDKRLGTEVEVEARKRGISRSALFEAKAELGIQSKKEGKGKDAPWYWLPPAAGDTPAAF